MKSVFKISVLTVAIAAVSIFSTPAIAGSAYESSFSAPLTSPVKLDIRLSEDMAYRAENLPKKLSDRGGSSRLNSGFGNNGYYGEKDLSQLQDRLRKRLTERFDKAGLVIDENASMTLVVTIEDAKPNRPTFKQLSKEPSLSFKSFGTGGAEVTGELIDAAGNSLGTADYSWFETNIRDAQFGSTWSDAHRAFRSFAKKIGKDLAQQPNI
ncbi:uncharacterized protein DUF3313 [Litorimonas taeanensis]|uniref:Uncharacterized protein DUF3313 n=1 Tax=Litorimonas taeanensis TaxID=568099 RepID=A0A420WJL2_9PROT|nr:DUF3313 family protein [Litorimonas taeanensis]RKQ71221.1 uncharacterized protein DUF3313 [Litorimonas taeanensis]